MTDPDISGCAVLCDACSSHSRSGDTDLVCTTYIALPALKPDTQGAQTCAVHGFMEGLEPVTFAVIFLLLAAHLKQLPLWKYCVK